ncbi:MAG TPA: AAA family ATPase [Thermomicrobiales bacterium]|nr:AAA family ATPase [Thermomicrobiales bacterium]
MRDAADPGIEDSPSALVGRERELAALRGWLAAAQAGHGRLVLLSGEAGIGKTSLAEALCAEAAERGALVLAGHCYDLAETPPYGPWVDLLAGYPPAGAGLPPIPAFLHDRAALAALGGQAALFDATAAFFTAVAARRPLVLVLDDLHWADQASLDLLRALARHLAAHRLLLLATYRADELTRRHPLYALLPLLVREARAERLDLHPLDEAGLRALVAGYTLPPADEGRLVGYLRERAEGNPFFAGELLRALAEVETLRPNGAGWALGDLAAAGVPPLLRQVIDARVDRLGDAARDLLAAAAVLGQEAPLDLWAAVAGVDEATLTAAAEGAAEAHLLVDTPGGAGVRFAHAIVREALYEGTLGLRRRALHRRAAEALAAGPAPDPDAVAHHFRQAGDARAADWLVRAGERAQRAYALLTAAERFEAAITLLEGHGADPAARGWLLLRLARMRRFAVPRETLAVLTEAARLGEAAGDRALVALCRLNLGYARCQAGDLRAGLADLAVGVEAHAALGPADRDRLRALPQTMAATYDEHNYRGLYALFLQWAGRYDEAEALAGDYDAPPASDTVAGGAGDSAYADAQAVLVAIHLTHGRPAAARAANARAVAAFRAVGHHNSVWLLLAIETWRVLTYEADRPAERRGLAAEVAAEWALARGAVATGIPDEPRLPLLLVEGQWARARAALEALRGEASGGWRAQLAGWLGPLARAQGDAALARSLVDEWLPDGPATEPGGTFYVCALALQRLAAALSLDVSDLPTARAWLEAHDRWLAWNGTVLGRAEGALGWAEYHRAAGDPTQAREHATAALAHANDPRQPLALLAAHRTLGELTTEVGQHAEAAAHLAEALALADACAAPYECALTLLATADLRAATGEREAAGTALAEARALLEPLEAKPALARADALAARLAAPAAPPPTYPAGLSAREVEVLRLVAQGLTDAQVAARLFLSPRTVGQHLRSVYTKLGVENRAAATRFAVEHHLA